MKNIVIFPVRSRFPVKVIYVSSFGLTASCCCLTKYIAINSLLFVIACYFYSIVIS